MKNLKTVNIITGWIIFLIASFVYLMTIEPTASFWDCGEFISTSYKLEVGHPPGAPFFMLIGRFFSLLASNPANVAKMINSLSALSSSATILFLFWTITHLAKKIVLKETEEIKTGHIIKIIGAGIVGSIAYTFSDTFWFSAVEGEVYALSSLFTAVVFWAILKWENVADERHANRWLILIAYLMGLSIGVHLLNLLAIPAIVLVYYFRKYETDRKSLIYAIGIAVVLLLIIMYGIIPGIVKVASVFELIFVNSMGLNFNSGLLFYILLLLACITFGLYITFKKESSKYGWIITAVAIILLGIPFITNNKFWGFILTISSFFAIYFIKEKRVILNTILLGATVIVLGYSSFSLILIRSLADPPMDQNNPETLFGLQYYLNREQYGDRPLFYGQYYSAPVLKTESVKPIYTAIDGEYKETSQKIEYVYDEKFTTVFPRMYSRETRHINAYQQWGKIKGKKIRTRGEDGKQNAVVKPTFTENLRFFFRYQVNFMYLRYFYWNFVGRQNDVQGFGYNQDGSKDLFNGNWISGIKFIDESRLGPQDNLPDKLKKNKGRNTYFFLPLILGLAGILYQYKKHNKDFWVILVLFFMTGLAIVLYLNQYPYQPRERDYAYAGSFYAFAIWIGLGVMLISDIIKKISTATIGSLLATIICLALVPGIMAAENWDDHDRSGCYTARDFAFNYLHSCQKNAILFTNGDNDTFPLWYAQEVEGVRTDVRVCNLSYLSADWYIEQMQRKAYESDPLPFTMTKKQYLQGKRDVVYILEELKNSIDLQSEAMPWVASDNPRTKVGTGDNQYDFFPSKYMSLKVDKEKVLENGLVNEKYADQILDTLIWSLPGRYITKNHLMVLDILAGNNWERPIQFAITVASENYINLKNYFQTTGLAYKFVPVKNSSDDNVISGIDTDEMYNNMMNKFKWGGVKNEDVYLNENNQRMLMNFRNNFAQLADALINEGKNDMAKNVLNKSIAEIPNNTVPFNFVMLPYIGSYYELGDNESAKEISDIIEKNIIDELKYYMKFRGELSRSVNYNIRINMSVLARLSEIASEQENNEEAVRLMKLYNDYSQRIQKII